MSPHDLLALIQGALWELRETNVAASLADLQFEVGPPLPPGRVAVATLRAGGDEFWLGITKLPELRAPGV